MDALACLAKGNDRLRRASEAMGRIGIMEALGPFSPVLCGTIPLGIDLPGSDLDVICEAQDLQAFEAAVTGAFGGLAGFAIRRREKQGLPTVICSFEAEGFAFEVFGQPLPAVRQNAYRHMVAEARRTRFCCC